MFGGGEKEWEMARFGEVAGEFGGGVRTPNGQGGEVVVGEQ